MRNKKTFTSPRVLQTVEVRLEGNLLQGPSSLSNAYSTGQEKEDVDYDTTWD